MPKQKFLHGKNGIIVTFSTELIIAGIGAYLSFTSIGTPLSNASGTVIRSTVTSGLYAFIMVIGFMLFGLDLSVRIAVNHPSRLRLMLASGLIATATSLPFLIYYNFYFSYTTVINGTSYTVFPYAVQTGIPFMLALLLSFCAWIQMFSAWINKRKIHIRIGPVIRISKGRYAIEPPDEDDGGKNR